MTILIYSLLFSIVVLAVTEVFNRRSQIKTMGDQMGLEIINNYIKENDQTYWNYYGQGSRQKVIGREENLVVVNFKNQDQMLANSLKSKQ